MFFLFACVIGLSGEIVWGAENILQVKIASTPPQTYSVRTVFVQQEPFVALDELAKVVRWQVSIQSNLNLLTVSITSNTIKVAGDNPYFIVNDQIFQMPLESRYHAGHVYVPFRYLFPILQDQLPKIIRYSDENHLLEVTPQVTDTPSRPEPPPQETPAIAEAQKPEEPKSSPFNLIALSIEEKANGTLVRLQSTQLFRESDFSSWVNESGWLYVQIYGGRFDPSIIGIAPGKGFIERVVPVQQPQLAQVSLKLKDVIESHEVGQDPRTKEIFITLYRKISATPLNDKVVASLQKEKEKWNIDVIALDAGHGGQDPGTIGRSNRLREKDVVLDITRRVGNLIEKKTDIKVVLTRANDQFIPLWQRTQIANQAKAKLFISIHGNSSPSRNANGFEVFILRPGKDKDAIAVAEEENKVVKMYEGTTNAYDDFLNGNKMLYSILQAGFAKESEEMAARVSSELANTLEIPNRGVKQAGFLVLWRASMPNILVEVGFLSNRSEERKLTSAAYRQRIAEGVFKGIREFIQEKQNNMARATQ